MTEAPVVCNASPLIALHQIESLDVLRDLFATVKVPPGVVAEVSHTISLPQWVEPHSLVQPVGPLILSASLGRGESEAISLALEVDARLVILDDRPARRLAQSLKLPVIGTLGLLLAAKQRNLIPAVKPCLDGLMQHDFRVAPALYEQVLIDAGEIR